MAGLRDRLRRRDTPSNRACILHHAWRRNGRDLAGRQRSGRRRRGEFVRDDRQREFRSRRQAIRQHVSQIESRPDSVGLVRSRDCGRPESVGCRSWFLRADADAGHRRNRRRWQGWKTLRAAAIQTRWPATASLAARQAQSAGPVLSGCPPLADYTIQLVSFPFVAGYHHNHVRRSGTAGRKAHDSTSGPKRTSALIITTSAPGSRRKPSKA